MSIGQKKKVMTTEELAHALGYEPDTIRRAAKAGKIPAIRLGRNFRYDPRAVSLALNNTAKLLPPGK